jgi:hypothetical protein
MQEGREDDRRHALLGVVIAARLRCANALDP